MSRKAISNKIYKLNEAQYIAEVETINKFHFMKRSIPCDFHMEMDSSMKEIGSSIDLDINHTIEDDTAEYTEYIEDQPTLKIYKNEDFIDRMDPTFDILTEVPPVSVVYPLHTKVTLKCTLLYPKK